MSNQDESDDLTKSLPTKGQESELSIHPSDVIPRKFGRYEVCEPLGEGGFGNVYLGRDSSLDRLVAIKVPNSKVHRSLSALQSFLSEAKLVANLRHPGIVTVFDYGTEGSVPYIVLEYIRGRTLADYLVQETPTFSDTARMMHSISIALHHAHTAGFIHRDLKPQNVLLDGDDLPHVSDFGLALRYRDELVNKRGTAGTPAYMAPEQAMGENHRIDERTDIWALGVMLYQMLCGKKPFSSSSDFAEMVNKILESRIVEPSKIVAAVPPELERICLRCLSRRMANRYRTARELADDLESWLKTDTKLSVPMGESTTAKAAGNEVRHVHVVPRGLRAYESEDANFFIDLLPGPHDRNGLPLSLRFWKDAIELRDPDNAFRVGVLYGPSGSGKSSLVRAGIVPLISQGIHVIHIDATDSLIEQKLVRQLRRLMPALSEKPDLVSCMYELREGQNQKKILIVIDQFEQWLSQNAMELNNPLVQALRQCDGANLQCLILVRDDFWRQVTRCMRQLEIDVVDQQNAMLVDSFDKEHGMFVLHKLGIGYDRLPENPEDLSRLQRDFLQRAVSELAEQGQLFPVRLVIFAEMMRDQSWVPATLDSMGGMTGIGVAFLEKSIGSKASTARRIFTRPAQKVLAAVLPPQGHLKLGAVETRELRQVSGLSESPHDFDQMMRLLHTELRLLTPTAREDSSQSSGSGDSSSKSFEPAYQLTHDYLVPSIREWIQLELKDTRQGRLSLALQDQANQWHARNAKRNLPTYFEFLQYRFGTTPGDWSETEARMMAIAGKRFARAVGFWTLTLSALLVVLLVVDRWIKNANLKQHVANLAGSVEHVGISKLPTIFQELDQNSDLSQPPLRRIYMDLSTAPELKFRASIFLARRDGAVAEALTRDLIEGNYSASYFPFAVARLADHSDRVIEVLHARKGLLDRADQLLRLACIWVRYQPQAPIVNALHEDIVDALLNQPAVDARVWIDALQPIAEPLLPVLKEKISVCPHLEGARVGIMALREYQKERPAKLLVELVDQGSEAAFRAALEGLRLHSTDAVEANRERLQPLLNAETGRDDKLDRIASLTLMAWLLGDDELVRQALNARRNTSLREHLIAQITSVRCDRDQIQKLIEKEVSRDAKMASILLLGYVALANPPLPQSKQQEWIKLLEELYQRHTDAELHAAVGCVLKQSHVDLAPIDQKIIATARPNDQEWLIDPSGQTFIQVGGTHNYAISSTEVTVDLLKSFSKAVPDLDELEMPATKLLHAEIGRFCNRLSEHAGFPPSQWCYPDSGASERNYLPYPDYLQRLGYRLPTDDEWNYALRSGQKTLWLNATNPKVMDKFCWDRFNTFLKLQSCASKLPNSLGIFDMYGNASELCYVNERVLAQDSAHALVENGGSVLSPAEKFVGAASKEVDRTVRATYTGFRLARTLRPSN